MFGFLSEVRALEQEGKLHNKLIARVRILFIISLILLGVVLYNLIFHEANPLLVTLFALGGFLLGLYVFARMNVVNWNEEEEIVQTGKMDIAGYLTIALYIAVEISFRTFLKDVYPLSSTAFLFAGIFGTIFGRAIGTVLTIHKVFRATHTQ